MAAVREVFILSIIFCASGETSAYISMDNEFLPVENCSKAYMEILHSEFGCAKGSLQYCSRGYYDWPDDITEVKFWKNSKLFTNFNFISPSSSRRIASKVIRSGK